MKVAIKTCLIGGFALLALVVVAIQRGGSKPLDTSKGQGFEVVVIKPISARPIFGILGDGAFGLPPNEIRLSHETPGVTVVRVDPTHLEFRADAWNVTIEVEDERIAPRTRVVFPMELAERQRSFRSRPPEHASGFFRVASANDAGELEGEFRFELAHSEDAETGKRIKWPSTPLTVRGKFRLPLNEGNDGSVETTDAAEDGAP